MIVTCPNCRARYRIPDTAGAARMRCAACQHRWVPGEEAIAAHLPDPTPLPVDLRSPEAGGGNGPQATVNAPTGSPSDEAAPLPHLEEEEEEPRPRIVATIAAIIIGLALAVVAAGLWVDDSTRAQLATVPGLGELLARIDPAQSPLKIALHGQVTAMGSNNRLLEVTGTLTNPTATSQTVPPLKASLSGPNGTALRWTIAPPTASLAPGASVPFTSTVTGFPADATRLSVTPG